LPSSAPAHLNILTIYTIRKETEGEGGPEVGKTEKIAQAGFQ